MFLLYGQDFEMFLFHSEVLFFIVSDTINLIGGVAINIYVEPAKIIHLYDIIVVVLDTLLTGANLF